jgi:hypothetical protein
MTIYKSKGKEFDELLIYEDPYQGRFVPWNATPKRRRTGTTNVECWRYRCPMPNTHPHAT